MTSTSEEIKRNLRTVVQFDLADALESGSIRARTSEILEYTGYLVARGSRYAPRCSKRPNCGSTDDAAL